ncbi:hypothetical protein QBC47DRAFT_386868 [Echria macrotheca]|uniref:Uncharacterized protein n=1 Tax=Echria macrotheca TaxID=438768 RepID=A0AAJ0B8I5_9PEZI|nr:hypothetical protein QBC47DRAFT_386868 [Echria macrotheca]
MRQRDWPASGATGSSQKLPDGDTDQERDPPILSASKSSTPAGACYTFSKDSLRSTSRRSKRGLNRSMDSRDGTSKETTLEHEDESLTSQRKDLSQGVEEALLHSEIPNHHETHLPFPPKPTRFPSATSSDASLTDSKSREADQQRLTSQNSIIPKNSSRCLAHPVQWKSQAGREGISSQVYHDEKAGIRKTSESSLRDRNPGNPQRNRRMPAGKHQGRKAFLLLSATAAAMATFLWDRSQREGTWQGREEENPDSFKLTFGCSFLVSLNPTDTLRIPFAANLSTQDLRIIALRLVDYHPFLLIFGVFGNVTALTAYYHLHRGSKYRDLILVAVFIATMSFGYFLGGLDVPGVLLQLMPWSMMVGLVLCS